MMTNKELLIKSNKDCSDKIHDVTNKFNTIVTPKIERFQRNVIGNIPQEFGNFLYTSLGDRVTGQRSSVLNTTYFENDEHGKECAKKALEAKQSIEEYLKEDQKTNGMYYNHHQPKLYITAGRKFGLSYLTGNGGRVHTMYFGAGSCFKYLTQEHVDCIKNKEKKECTQMFLDYRNEFASGLDNLHDKLIPVDIPVDLGMVNKITSKRKYPSNGYYNNNTDIYFIMEDYKQDRITHVYTSVKSVDIWDKISYTNSTVKSDRITAPSYISFRFMNIDDTKKTTRALFNLDVSVEMGHGGTIDSYNNKESSTTINKQSYVNLRGGKLAKGTIYDYDHKNCEGVILNIDDVFNNSIVDKTIEDSINFYVEMTDKLRDIKHEQSALYFLNGDM
jgi:hypothetical protein